MSMNNNTLSSSTPHNSHDINFTHTFQEAICTVDATSKSKCLPFPLGTSEPVPQGANSSASSTAAALNTSSTAAVIDISSRGGALKFLSSVAKDLEHLSKAADEVKEYGNRISNQITDGSQNLKSLDDSYRRSTESLLEDPPILIETDVQEGLLELQRKVVKLKLQLSSVYELHNSDPKPHPTGSGVDCPCIDSPHGGPDASRQNLDKVPNLCKDETLECTPEFEHFKALYDGLSDKEKVCLLCFSLFPEKEIINKRFMIYWWIGEDFVTPMNDKEQLKLEEDLANEVFSELMAKGFIEPVFEKHTLECLVHKCRMHPFVRSATVLLARKAKFFNLDQEGNLKLPRLRECPRICLLAGKLNGHYLGTGHALFNVDETFLDFNDPKPLDSMEKIEILCLGRWQATPKHHIEVEDTKFLEDLKTMKHLKFLSLQGISNIIELPQGALRLPSLKILDLRDCHNLVKLPDITVLFESLTHLDISGCYLLDTMPIGLSFLSQLQVLKGFVVDTSINGETSCTLQNLANLKKLRKLSIYARRDDFPTMNDLQDFNKLQEIRKLTIAWLRRSSQGKTENTSLETEREERPAGGAATQENPREVDTQYSVYQVNIREMNSPVNAADSRATVPSTKKQWNCFKTVSPTNSIRGVPSARRGTEVFHSAPPELPPRLEKLDLQCCPHTCPGNWVQGVKLNCLKKLYIRGGKLQDLGQIDCQKGDVWTVEILRLRFLNDLKMNWGELQKLFPKLVYLEKESCPKLELFPCDKQGVWMSISEKSNYL